MTAGDLVTSDWQVEVRGRVYGPGTGWRVAGLDDWSSRKVRSNDQPRAGSHGAFLGGDLVDAAVRALRLNAGNGNIVTTPTELAELRDDLLAAWAPEQQDIPIVWQVGGKKRLRWGRTRNIDVIENDLTVGYIEAVCEWVDGDGFSYSASEKIAGTSAPTPAVGRTYPRLYAWTYGPAGTGGSMQVVNEGTAPAPWKATIAGPCSEPRLVTDSGLIVYGADLQAGETLVLDSRDRSVLLQGTASRYALLDEFRWFDLPPGTSEVRFSTADSQGGVFLSWRDTWW